MRKIYIYLRNGHAGPVNVSLDLMTNNHPPDSSRPQFPSHNEPRVWVITAGDSPIGTSVTRQILEHGDYALIGLAHSNLDRDECRLDEFEAFMAEVESEGWGQRLKSIPLDIRCGLVPKEKKNQEFYGLRVLWLQDDGRVSGCCC